MAKVFFDAGAEAKKRVNKRYAEYYEKAKAASDDGKLKLVSEQICQPFQGYSLQLDKGQIIRYEMIDGRRSSTRFTMSAAGRPRSGPTPTTRP